MKTKYDAYNSWVSFFIVTCETLITFFRAAVYFAVCIPYPHAMGVEKIPFERW